MWTFKYSMALIDASTRWPHVCLISTRNLALARLLAQIILITSTISDYVIKMFRLDNTGEFTSQAFNDYCVIELTVEHPVSHVHHRVV